MKSTNWIEVDFSDWVHRNPGQDTFNIIKGAIFQKRVISFCYFSGTGKKEKRNVKPIRLVFKSKSWYLYSFCLLRNDYRFFKLTRIKAAFRVYDEFTDKIAEDSQGNLYVQVDLPDNEILYSYVMSFSNCAEIIEPQSIREQMKKRLQEMQEKYKT